MENIFDNLKCPISQQIFYDPVICSDGHTYEKDLIINWIKINNTSPLTRESNFKIINFNNILLKNIIKSFLNQYPEYKEDQYKIIEEITRNNIKFLTDKELIDKIKYNYNSFNNFETLKYIIHYRRYNVLKELLKFPIDKYKLLNYSFENSNEEICLIIINSGELDLNYKDELERSLLYNSMKFKKYNISKLLIEKGVYLNAVNINKTSIFTCSLQYAPDEICKLLIDKNCDINIPDVDKIYPIHYTVIYSRYNILKLLIEKKVDLSQKTAYNKMPIDFAREKYKTEYIKLLENK